MPDFWKDERGAVTVDYVVLLGGATAMAIGALIALQTGMLGMSTTTAEGVTVGSSYRVADGGVFTRIVEMDFDDGTAPGWSHNSFSTAHRLNQFFGQFGTETRFDPVTYTTEINPYATAVRIGFDLLIIDSWDGLPGFSHAGARGDGVRLSDNGTQFSHEFFVNGGYATPRNRMPNYYDDRVGEYSEAGVTYSYTMTQVSHTLPRDENSGRPQRWQVVVEITNPPASLEFGIIGDLSQGVHDESFGIDNFWVDERL